MAVSIRAPPMAHSAAIAPIIINRTITPPFGLSQSAALLAAVAARIGESGLQRVNRAAAAFC
jgi:hypothetical protein